MNDEIETQIYLSVPAHLTPETLESLLASVAIACVRCSVGEDKLGLDALRETCHARQTPLIAEAPDGLAVEIAKQHGLDGVHIAASPKTVAYARKTLEKGTIIGADAGISRHDGMSAAEAGADYVAFAADVDPDLIIWWAQVVETPLVASVTTPIQVKSLKGIADFICVGEDIWSAEEPTSALLEFAAALRSPAST